MDIRKIKLLNSKIVSVGTYFPNEPILIKNIGERIQKESKIKLPVKVIEKLTGVQQVFHRSEGENTSDLAVQAGLVALQRANIKPKELDLIIFASASQDLIEPATSHIISAKMGATCPVFDVSNACNSFLNGLQIADVFIRQGVYKNILVVTGEAPSVAIRWSCANKDQFISAFPGYSMSDTGGAVLVSADVNISGKRTGIESIEMTAHSQMWDVGVLGTGGSRHPRDLEATYFNMDGHRLFEAFKTLGCEMLFKKLNTYELNWNDFKHVGMHQVSSIYNGMLLEELGLPENQVVTTIHKYGNLASNSFSVQLETVFEDLKHGDKFAFVGLGGGISTGLGVFSF